MIDRLLEMEPGYGIDQYLIEKGLAPPEPTSRPENHLLTSDEVKGRLGGISRMSLHRLVVAGQLPVVRIGSRTLFDPGDVDAFVKRAKQRGTAARKGGGRHE